MFDKEFTNSISTSNLDGGFISWTGTSAGISVDIVRKVGGGFLYGFVSTKYSFSKLMNKSLYFGFYCVYLILLGYVNMFKMLLYDCRT